MMKFRSLFSIDSEMSNADLNALDQRAHSKAYHRFFAGYTERLEPQADGTSKIRRVYTGFYYSQELSRAKRAGVRLLYLFLLIAVLLLYGSNGVARTEINSVWYVAVSQLIFLPIIFWTGVAFANYIPKSQRMTIYEYQTSSVSLRHAALTAALIAGVETLTTLFYHFTAPVPIGQELAMALKYAVNMLALLAISLIEGRIHYRKELSEKSGQESGVPILM